MSPALTVLDALHRFNFATTFISDKLVIHALGLEAEQYHQIIFEEVAHQLPSVKRLVVNFVGPQVGQHVNDQEELCATCEACRVAGRVVTFVKSK